MLEVKPMANKIDTKDSIKANDNIHKLKNFFKRN